MRSPAWRSNRGSAEWFTAHEPTPRNDLFSKLGDLALLTRLEAHAAWFLETGYFDTARSRAIRRDIEKLLRELAPHAREVVDAFGIPDACLAAPIAFFDPAHPTYP